MLMFFYGSLREGFYNNERMHTWGRANKVSKEPIQIAGWDLYDLGAYPAAFHSGRPNAFIIGEVWEVDAQAARMVEIMEEGAGYYRDDVSTDQGMAFIWAMEGAPQFGQRVKSGDWANKDGPDPIAQAPLRPLERAGRDVVQQLRDLENWVRDPEPRR